MNINCTQILDLADVIPGHHLRYIEEVPCFNSWGVQISPDSEPETLLIGEESREFTAFCYPFMAAHEALHSICSLYYFEGNYFRFFLYNVVEDARINAALLRQRPELAESYQQTRKIVLSRWEERPISLKSPHSRMLQYMCMLNHIQSPGMPRSVESDRLGSLIRLREAFLQESMAPLMEGVDRDRRNRDRSEHLIELLREQPVPQDIDDSEIRKLLVTNGYFCAEDMSLYMELAEEVS